MELISADPMNILMQMGCESVPSVISPDRSAGLSLAEKLSLLFRVGVRRRSEAGKRLSD